jgi:hypothetical protein
MAIEVDSSLRYRYYGGDYADPRGYAIGKVTQGWWDILNFKLEAMRYEELDTFYGGCADAMASETILHFHHKTKRITGEIPCLPYSLSEILISLIHSPEYIKLTPSTDTLPAFETRYQIPPSFIEFKLPEPVK